MLDDKKIKELREMYGSFFLMVARFTKEKDHKTVVDALEILKKQYQMNHKLVFVGEGPGLENVKKYVSQRGLQKQIVFTGGQYDVQNYYSAAELYIHSSPAEGLPTVLLESMSFGLPIVATNSLPGVPEILMDGECGCLCEIGNSREMAEKIVLLMENRELYEAYSERGKIRIQDFQPEHVLKELKTFLDSI